MNPQGNSSSKERQKNQQPTLKRDTTLNNEGRSTDKPSGQTVEKVEPPRSPRRWGDRMRKDDARIDENSRSWEQLSRLCIYCGLHATIWFLLMYPLPHCKFQSLNVLCSRPLTIDSCHHNPGRQSACSVG